MSTEDRIAQIAAEEHTDPMRRIDLQIKLVNLIAMWDRERAEDTKRIIGQVFGGAGMREADEQSGARGTEQ